VVLLFGQDADLDSLDAERVEDREAAAARLVDQGERARPALEAAARQGPPERRARARELLDRLDRVKNLRGIEAHSGRLGKEGAFWVSREAFDLVGDERNLPDWMTAALVRDGRPTLILVEADGAGVQASRVCQPCWAGAPAGATLTLDWYGTSEGPNYGKVFLEETAHGEPPEWAKKLGKRQTSELFRVWPELRRASVVFVAPSSVPRADGVGFWRPALDAFTGGLKSERAGIRAGAAHALRHLFLVEAVAAAIDGLGDADAAVRKTALGTVQELADAPEGDAREVRLWWEAKDRPGRLAALDAGFSRRARRK
jgi:hypothetical protein